MTAPLPQLPHISLKYRTPLLSTPMSIDNSKGTVGRVAVKYQRYGSISSPISQPQAGQEREPEHKGKIIIHCVRHAQALHNLNLPHSTKESRASIPDPPLTAAGYRQCALLSLAPPFPLAKITHVYSSPSIRCIETASLSFRGLFTSLAPNTNANAEDMNDGECTTSDSEHQNQNKDQAQNPNQNQRHKIVLWADLKELGPRPCNNGSGIETLKREFKDLDLDLGLLDEGWEERNAGLEYGGRRKLALNIRKTLYEISTTAIQDKRVDADGNVEILVISHGGLLSALTTDTNKWHNAEVRSFELIHQTYQSHRPKDRYTLLPITTSPSPSNSTTLTFPLDLPSLATLRTLGWKRSELAILKTRSSCTNSRKKIVQQTTPNPNPNSKPKPKLKSKLLSCQVQGRIMTYCRGSRRAAGDDSELAREDGRKRWQGFRIFGGY
ncbi:hypothetical protein DL95DRAFT_445933 [Leptodontidium sp. 2 PMI_412]|nr:hypothetical protein DL95DRAFT_445933 [Leptodontidium sp. 2 PMI_412]